MAWGFGFVFSLVTDTDQICRCDDPQVLAVRNDLKMGKGKVAAQCSHATLGLYKKVFHCAPKALQRWEMCSQVKVVTKVNSEQEMLFLQVFIHCLTL
jgi:PTH2 family peptidyl-tRNA hydrolase